MSAPLVVIAAHKPLAGDPRPIFHGSKARGGERSVAIIRDYLADRYRVRTVVRGYDDFDRYLHDADVVLSWATGVPLAHPICQELGIPLIHMVRWWRNVAPLPPGDLMERPLDADFIREHRRYFEDASAVITNNYHATRIIKRWYRIESRVSYVAVPGDLQPGGGDPGGYITLITDNKGVRGAETIRDLARIMPDLRFRVVNAYHKYERPNIETVAYAEDMSRIWETTSILLNPIYDHDGCGTGRTVMEAARHCVPSIGSDRAGLLETGGYAVSRDADAEEWATKIRYILGHYGESQRDAIDWFEDHDAGKELAVYDDAIKEAL